MTINNYFDNNHCQVFLILVAILPLMLYTAFIIFALYSYLKEAYIDVGFIFYSPLFFYRTSIFIEFQIFSMGQIKCGTDRISPLVEFCLQETDV